MDDSPGSDRPGEQYERILETMADGVYVLDEDATYVHVNDYLVELSGYDCDRWLGASPDLVHTEAEIATFERVIEDLWRGDEAAIETVRATIERADGERIPVDVNLALVPPADGAFRGTVGTVRDVSNRLERERELERYETMVQTVPDELYTLDVDGVITSFTPPAGQELTTLGYRADELVGEHVSLVMTDLAYQRGAEARERLLDSDGPQTVTYEIDLVTADGERVPYENHFTLLPGDDEAAFGGTVGVLRDVSNRKERERQLKRQNERLEEFASVVSHDIRNPLNVATGRLELLDDECESEHLEPAADALDRVDRIIDEVLTLSREGDVAGAAEQIALAAVARGAWANVATRDANLAVTDVTVQADPDRLQRLLENLFSNAIDHGTEGAADGDPTDALTVRVGPLADRHGFFVADDGVGIPPGERETVFEPGHTTAADGTGFGLAIVERIATASEWHVSLTAGDEGGARFEFVVDGDE